MKTLIVVKSTHHQNTARVAQAMAGVLQADVVSPEDVLPEQMNQYDLVGFGSEIYFGRFHSKVRQLIRRLPPTEKSRPIFLFFTAGLPFLRRLWHWPVRRRLIKLGYLSVGEFGCRGFDTVGPLFLIGGLNRKHPDERDLTRARDFARQLHQISEEQWSTSAEIRANQ